MLLRCTVNEAWTPFVKGRMYDVVEILEFPDHCMVRKPDGRWPKPGDRYFGYHPDTFFETPKKKGGLEIISCGYRYVTDKIYGVVIPNPKPVLTKKRVIILRKIWDDSKTATGYSWRWLKNGTPLCEPHSYFTLGIWYQDAVQFGSVRKMNVILNPLLRRLRIKEKPKYHYVELWQKYYREPGLWSWPPGPWKQILHSKVRKVKKNARKM